MTSEGTTYTGPAVNDPEVFGRLPPDLAGLLEQANGFVRYGGGLHVRGACRGPAWHSLHEAWLGPAAFQRLYPDVTPGDIPFAEDPVGDQFLLRDGTVWKLEAETGDLDDLGLSLDGFLAAAEADPDGFLSLEPLLQFQAVGGKLEPGELLSVYPPFCTAQAANGVSLEAVPAADRRAFLADFARQIRDLPDGGSVEIETGG